MKKSNTVGFASNYSIHLIRRILILFLLPCLLSGLFSLPASASKKTLPVRYDLRKEGFVTAVRSQKDYGLCWAFAACAAMESNALKQGLGHFDLSEVHLAYFALTGVKEPLPGLNGDTITFRGDEPWYQYGGYSGIATTFLMNGYGPVKESFAPLSMLPKHPSDDSAYGHNVLSLVGTLEIPARNQNSLKRAIMENGAIVCGTSLSFDNSRYFNKKTASLYVNVKKDITHDMVIVGWNDKYSRKNFGKVKPKKNGAWLCKNCWGKKWGNSGYFWLSYEDVPSLQDICYSYIVSSETTGTIYQYDGGYGAYGYENTFGIANVYTAGKTEKLHAVSACLEPCTGTLSIYKGSATSPDNGTLLYSQKIRVKTSGYAHFTLHDSLTLKKGESFSVVFTFDTPCFANIDYDDIGDWYIDSDITAHKGESYIKQAKTGWFTSDSFNCRIKAYTLP